MKQNTMVFSKVFVGPVHFPVNSPVAASEEQSVNVRVNFSPRHYPAPVFPLLSCPLFRVETVSKPRHTSSARIFRLYGQFMIPNCVWSELGGTIVSFGSFILIQRCSLCEACRIHGSEIVERKSSDAKNA